MNSKPRQAPPGGVSAVAHTLTANDAAPLTLNVAEHCIKVPKNSNIGIATIPGEPNWEPTTTAPGPHQAISSHSD
jgi:hypothetical protein